MIITADHYRYLEKVQPEFAAALKKNLEAAGIFNSTAYVFVNSIKDCEHGIACVYDVNERGQRFYDKELNMASCRDVVW